MGIIEASSDFISEEMRFNNNELLEKFMKWQDHFKANTVTADEAVKNVKNGNRIFVSGNATLPTSLTDALVKRGNELEGVEMN
ncbi:MAG TPA: hypothetical protein PK683_19890, partial [Leptospiraceae bacterium]|nr:hypothetical protein [Leptospiraceae bacterium]